MAVLQVVTYPADPIVLRPAHVVTRVNQRVRHLMHDMLETMYAATGVGLAAPQVGVGQRVIVVDVGQGPIVLVNPEIRAAAGEQLGLEGCLSLPDLVGEVPRAERAVVGEPITVEADGLLARALQHEVDHLDGILFIARIKDPMRLWKASELKTEPPGEAIRIWDGDGRCLSTSTAAAVAGRE